MCTSAQPACGLAGLGALLLASACGSSGGGGGGGEEPDEIPPAINAQPAGGHFPEDVLVTLSANEPATVFYTTDGSLPMVGGLTTQSGSAPIVGIPIQGPDQAETTRLLQYFGIDGVGNVGPVIAQAYTIDKIVPEVFPLGDDPAPIGILDSAVLTWAASDDGAFAVELGGNGTLGSGILVDSGLYGEPGVVMQSEIPGTLLQPSPDGEHAFVYVTDVAGNQGSAMRPVSLRGFGSLQVPADVTELAFAPDPADPLRGRLYVATASTQVLGVVDTEAGEVIGKVALGCGATALTALGDGSRAYVGCAGAILEIDTMNLAVAATLPVPNGATPSGLAATPDGARVYFGSSDGILLFVDTASQQVLPTDIVEFPIESCRIAITPSPTQSKGLVAWKGAGSYGAFVFDAPTGTLLGTPFSPASLSPPGAVAVTSSTFFERGFLGDFLNRVTRISLLPPEVEQFVLDSSLWGVAVVPGDEILLLTHPDDLELEFRTTQDLALFTRYDLARIATPPAVPGLGLPLAIERLLEGNVLVTRGWFVQEQGGAPARLIRVPLMVVVF